MIGGFRTDQTLNSCLKVAEIPFLERLKLAFEFRADAAEETSLFAPISTRF